MKKNVLFKKCQDTFYLLVQKLKKKFGESSDQIRVRRGGKRGSGLDQGTQIQTKYPDVSRKKPHKGNIPRKKSVHGATAHPLHANHLLLARKRHSHRNPEREMLIKPRKIGVCLCNKIWG